MITIAVGVSGISQPVIVKPGVSLRGSFSISLGSRFSLSLPLAVVAMVSIRVSMIGRVTVMMTKVSQTMSIITIAVWVSGIPQAVIVQPWVSLGVSLSSGLGLFLLPRHCLFQFIHHLSPRHLPHTPSQHLAIICNHQCNALLKHRVPPC